MAVKNRKPAPTVPEAAAGKDRFDLLLDLAERDPAAIPGNTPTEGNPVTLGPAVLPPDEWAAKQIRRTQAAGEDYLKGVLAPRREPLKAALEANAKYKAAVQKAVAEDRFARGVAATDETQMYETIRKVGSSGYVAGVTAREGKIKAKIAKLQPMVAASVADIAAMPNVTDTDAKNRMIKNFDNMVKIGQRLRGGA